MAGEFYVWRFLIAISPCCHGAVGRFRPKEPQCPLLEAGGHRVLSEASTVQNGQQATALRLFRFLCGNGYLQAPSPVLFQGHMNVVFGPCGNEVTRQIKEGSRALSPACADSGSSRQMFMETASPLQTLPSLITRTCVWKTREGSSPVERLRGGSALFGTWRSFSTAL